MEINPGFVILMLRRLPLRNRPVTPASMISPPTTATVRCGNLTYRFPENHGPILVRTLFP